MARSCMRVFLLVLLPLTVVACAQGFEGNSDDDVQTRVDARITVQIDAPSTTPIDAPATPIDAPATPIDAPVGLPDANTTGACTTHAECGAGNCCFGGLTCIPGDPLPLPPPFDCLPA